MAVRSRSEVLSELRMSLGRAISDYDNAKTLFAQPYSTHESRQKMDEARGYASGLAKAIEIMEVKK